MKKALLLLAGVALSAASASAADIYVRGGMNGWGTSANWKFQQVDDTDEYTLSVAEFPGKVEFKIADASWDLINYGGNHTSMVMDQEYTLTYNGGNLQLANTLKDVVITYNNSTHVLKFSAASSEEAEYGDLYLIGEMNNWNSTATNPNKCEKIEKGVYSYTGDFNAGETFKFGGVDWNPSVTANNTALTIGEYDLTLGGENNNMAFEKNMTNVTITLDLNNLKMTVTGEEGEETDYTTWYYNVPGAFNNWTDNGVTFSEEGVATINNLAIGNGEFEIKVWNGTADNYYGTSTPIEINTPTTVYLNGGHMTIAGAEAGAEYNVTFDVVTKTMTVTPCDPTAIEAISAADDATATYFNLQGARIANPENGIFIKVINGKATKIVK